jgi:glycolate oxidase iron-sulfur subunit
LQRKFLRFALTRRWIFGPAVKLGRLLRPLLPPALRAKLPPARAAGAWPARPHARKVLLLNGCVQPLLIPAIDAATARVLDALGIEAIREPASGCCGAIDQHLSAQAAARTAARRNIDAWWPHIERGIEAIVVNASGCGAMVKDYAHLLHDDPPYSEKATRIAALARDPAELVAPMAARLAALMRGPTAGPHQRVAFHAPCTLQHTQKLGGVTESLLAALGAELIPVADAHLCCGAAGTYALLQPELSRRLRAAKLENLQRGDPEIILSANVGCLTHLESGAGIPVRHWIEWVDSALGRVR